MKRLKTKAIIAIIQPNNNKKGANLITISNIEVQSDNITFQIEETSESEIETVQPLVTVTAHNRAGK